MNDPTTTTFSTVPMSSPVMGGGSGSNSAGASSYAVQTETESYSEVQWENIVILMVGSIGILLFFAVLFQAWQERQPRDEKPPTKGDAEAPTTEASPLPPSSTKPSLYAIPLLSSLLAIVFSIVTHASCDFLDLGGDDEFLAMGLWKTRYQYEYTPFTSNFEEASYDVAYNYRLTLVRGGECRKNDFHMGEYETDKAWEIARATGVIATIAGGLCFLFLIVYALSCWTCQRGLAWIKGSLALTMVLQLVPLCLLSTNLCEAYGADCDLNFGAVAAIMAAYFWFLACFALSILI